MTEKRSLFQEYLENTYPNNSGNIETILETPINTSFRINANYLKAAVSILESFTKLGINISEGPIQNTFLLPSVQTGLISKSIEHEEGKIYIQGLSSMYAVVVLDPKPNEKILDLCASPGSKTTMICSQTNQPENVVAVEQNRSRFFLLKKNLAKYGYEAVTTLNQDAALLPYRSPKYINYFDRVLADVPCSNAGVVRFSDQESLEKWNPKAEDKLPKLQKRLLKAAVMLTKPGGEIVYSTCTYSPKECEEVVAHVLKGDKNLELVDIAKPYNNFISGFGLPQTLRILPTENFDGFFIAKIKKLL